MKIKKFSEFYLTAQVAELLHIHRDTLKKWEKNGMITSVRDPGTKWRLFKKDDVHTLMEKLSTAENHV